MTDKEVQKLSRSQLIELLYYLSKELDTVKEDNSQLKARLDSLVGEAITACTKADDKEPAVTEAENESNESENHDRGKGRKKRRSNNRTAP